MSWNTLADNLKKKKGQLLLKRTADIALSLGGLVVLSPVLLLCGIAIKLDSPGEVFYRQVRVGKDGVPFRIFKFRTMQKDADKKGLEITVGGDARITRVGHFLRKTKLDELAQLLNILKGDMSFVGPRPEVPRYVELYTDQQKNVLLVRPGITDYASILYRNENDLLKESENPEQTYIDEIMPAKLELNRQYINEISLATDLKLIFKTIHVVAKD